MDKKQFFENVIKTLETRGHCSYADYGPNDSVCVGRAIIICMHKCKEKLNFYAYTDFSIYAQQLGYKHIVDWNFSQTKESAIKTINDFLSKERY